MSAAAVQLDLFGEVEAAEDAARHADTRRRRDALTCLIDAHPTTLDLLLGDRRLDRGEIRQGMSGDWCYSVRATGFHFADRTEHCRGGGGWYRRPAHRLDWDELDAIAADPRVDEIRAWADSLTAIDRWKDRYRPHEMWPHPDSWHPSYIDGDHERPGWPARHAAWLLTLTVLADAREAIR